MDINYMILAHKNPGQLSRLVKVLRAERTYFYIHIDKNTNIEPFKRNLKECDSVRFSSDSERRVTPWGDIGIIEATLNMLRRIIADGRKGICVLLSGQDYPIRSNKEIRFFFEKNKGINFIELFKVPTHRWAGEGFRRINTYKFNLSNKREDFVLLPSIFDKMFYTLKTFKQIFKALKRQKVDVFFRILNKRRFPDYVSPYGGEHWWALTTDTVKKVLAFVDEHPDYLEYHRNTLCVDEIFFHTIVGNTYEDEKNLVKQKIVYVDWERIDAPLPATLQKKDLPFLKSISKNYLFARKFDEHLDAKILDLIDTQLLTSDEMPQKQGKIDRLL